MKRTALNIALTLWLALSVGVWLFGIAFLGELYLPSPNVFTLLLIYGPWLVLFAIIGSRWLQRQKLRWAKPAAISLAALIALAIISCPWWVVAEERYFNAVLSSCQARHGIAKMGWEEVPMYHARVRRFLARSEADNRLIRCVNERAGFLIDDVRCPGAAPSPDADSALEVTSGTTHTVLPVRFFNVIRYRYTRAPIGQSRSDEQCPQ